MFYRRGFRPIIIALSSVLAMSALISAGAQEPPKPPPKPVEQKKSTEQKKADRRQGAQADQPQEVGTEAIKIDTDMVQLDVSVIDQQGAPIYTLTKNDFTVYEDRIQQTIESVSREEVPVSFGLVIDTSGSMRAKLKTVSDAALDLIKQMRTGDEGFIAQFKTEAELVTDFTNDKGELQEGLEQLFTGGGTSLLDAIIATADYAQDKGKRRRKALIVISDGLEQNSAVKEKEVLEAIKEDEVQVYMVGFLDESEPGGLFKKSPGKKAKELLLRIAEDSGGRAFFPQDVSEMSQIAAQIAKDLRTQYVISYYPSNDKRDGSYRALRVAVSPQDNRKLIARTRRGYYARAEKGPVKMVNDRKSK